MIKNIIPISVLLLKLPAVITLKIPYLLHRVINFHAIMSIGLFQICVQMNTPWCSLVETLWFSSNSLTVKLIINLLF